MEIALSFILGIIFATIVLWFLFKYLQKTQHLQFKAIADEILKENTSSLLGHMTDYKNYISSIHFTDTKDRESLREKINFMLDSAKKIETETSQLSRALSSDVKFQGAWGELTLERILELAGLNKGIEYFTQEEMTGEDFKQQRPDVVIKLPGDSHLIIDSKVSLKGYFDYEQADESQKDSALKQLKQSVTQHIDSLSKKNYQLHSQVQSVEFVYLFIPVEGVYTLILKHFPSLIDESIQKNIVLVSPVNLMANLRTVASLWRLEKQSQNAQELAAKAGAMYDKFATLIDDVDKLGSQLDRAKQAHENVVKKLSVGKGNLLTRADELKQLGARTSRNIQID